MNVPPKKIILCFAILVFSISSYAQFTKAYDDPDAEFKLAKELYQKQQFSLAYPLFRMLSAESKNNSSIPVSVLTESKYYSIICGLQLNDATAENTAQEFIALEHNEPRAE
ncbi:MAG TPA: hypothetical protein PL045_09025, partial [Chitinophagaceae bacterium]|nr:hypothetical protein [Chitinophagaceae bacterium]